MIKNYFSKVMLVAGALLATQSSSIAQCNCGTGADGAYVATSNTTLAGGTYNFTTFTINTGVTVTVTGNQPLIINATGNVNIDGALSANGGNGGNGITSVAAGVAGLGVAGGADGGAGTFSNSTGPLNGSAGNGAGAGGNGANWSGGGGAGYSDVGQSASASSTDGVGGGIYNDTLISTITGGSGGAGGSGGYDCGSGGGGGGGGYISIATCSTMTISATGQISANGGNGGSDGTGNCGGGGAGSGGSIVLKANSIVNNGNITALGGIGGTSTVGGSPYYGTGGNGAPGRIRVDYSNISGTGTTTPVVHNGTLKITATQTTAASCSSTCDGSATATAVGGSPAYAYTWMPSGGTGSVATALCTGTYQVGVMDANGCVTMTSVTILSSDVTDPVPDASSLSTVTNLCSATVSATPTATDNCAGSINGTTSDPLTYTTPGTHTITWSYNDGSGNTVTQTQQVVVTGIDTSVTLTGATLTATSSTATYAWLNCNTNTVVPGETAQSFTAGANGNYALIITESGCTDTSSCHNITSVGISGMNTTNSAKIYPNPTSGMVKVEMNQNTNVELTIQTIFGQIVRTQQLTGQQFTIDLSEFEEGIYMLNIHTPLSTQVIKVVKTN